MEFHITVNRSRVFTIVPQVDGVDSPQNGTSPALTTNRPDILEITPVEGSPWSFNVKQLTVDNAFLSWSFVNSNSATINGSDLVVGDPAPPPPNVANGGRLEAGPEF